MLNLLNVIDLMDFKILKFLRKLYHNNLTVYFNDYIPHLESRETQYNFRPYPLPEQFDYGVLHMHVLNFI